MVLFLLLLVSFAEVVLFWVAARSKVEGLQVLVAKPKSSMTAKVCGLEGAQLH